MIRLFACDLDGTLLNAQHESDALIEDVIRRVIESGRFFTVATGRSTSMIDFGEMNEQMYVICMNGSLILNPKREIIHYERIDQRVVRAMLEAFPQVQLECLTPTHAYVRQEKEQFISSMVERSKRMPDGARWINHFLQDVEGHMLFSQSMEEILRHDICKINCRVEMQEDAQKLRAYLQAHAQELVNAPSNSALFEITKSGVNKGSAVAWLAKQLGVAEQEIAVYGDGGNDLEMLSMFAHSYAPCTAQERALAVAKEIIGPYQDYSVAKHIAQTLEEHS